MQTPEWLAPFRAQFPVTNHYLYLNHAAVAPLPQCGAQAMSRFAEEACLHGSRYYDRWMACYEGLRQSTARLINAQASEIALVKNTSEGIATVQMGFPWKSGDVVVGFQEEFPANYYPWQKLTERGVTVRWLSIYATLEEIDEALAGARFLSISYVNYLSGHRVDLVAIGALCRKHGAFFFVDAIQGLGVFPLDVRAAHIDALAADGHKWLVGPEGCGVLYVRQEVQDQIEPVEFGWTNVAKWSDYASRDMTLRADAGRYEPGTLNTIGCFGLRASIDLILSVGVEKIGPRVQRLTDLLAQGLAAAGAELLLSRDNAAATSGILCFRFADNDSQSTVAVLRAKGVMCAYRQGWIRLSPHCYQLEDEMEEAVRRIVETVRE
jgi:cysteine desulfurase / selenocysteine lyase